MSISKRLADFPAHWFSLVLLGLILFAGCSGGDENRVSVYPVTGKVTMGGAPVANAIVTFSPQNKQPVAIGRTDSNGQYSLTTYDPNDGAAAGDYVVLVAKTGSSSPAETEQDMHQALNSGESAEAAMHAGAQEKESSGSLLPEKYGSAGSSDLAATVTESGDNKFDFDLSP